MGVIRNRLTIVHDYNLEIKYVKVQLNISKKSYRKNYLLISTMSTHR